MSWQIKFPLAKNTFNKIPMTVEHVGVTTVEVGHNYSTVKLCLKSSKKLNVALANFQTTVRNLLAKAVKHQQHLIQFRVPFGMSLTFPCKTFCDDKQLSFNDIHYNVSEIELTEAVTEPNSVVLIDSTSVGAEVRECVESVLSHYYSTNQLNAFVCCVVHS